MKIRITGTAEERSEVIELLKSHFDIGEISKEYDSRDDVRFKSVYVDIFSEDRKVTNNLQPFQVIEYCNNFRSKADVKRNFNLSFEAAEEILERLVVSGDLLKWVSDKKYVYLDSRYSRFIKARCGNCDHRGSFGCCNLSDNDDYMKVDHCCEKFEPSMYAFYDVITEANFRIINKEG